MLLVPADVQVWRIVPGFPDYEISNDGYLRRATPGSNAKAGKVIRFKIGTRGYPCYALSDSGGRRHHYNAHRLVAMAFLPPPTEGLIYVLHKDDNKLNVRDDNLKWGTAAENTADAIRNGCINLGERHPCKAKPWTRPRGESHSSAKLTEQQVLAILNDTRMQREIASEYGVDQALVGRIKNRKIWRHITDPEYRAMMDCGIATTITIVRKQLSSRELMALQERENRTCHLCDGPIKPTDAWDVSHEIPLALGGEDSDENRRIAHRKCHQGHTAKVDMPAIAKSRRIRTSFLGASTKPKRPLPFGRGSRLKKKINGQVVER